MSPAGRAGTGSQRLACRHDACNVRSAVLLLGHLTSISIGELMTYPGSGVLLVNAISQIDVQADVDVQVEVQVLAPVIMFKAERSR
jgi:hypothetical protein